VENQSDNRGVLGVAQLNEYIKALIDRDSALRSVYVRGEISNFKNHYSTGHFYFTLKDEGGVVRCVMFRSSASKLPFVPENGMKVVLHGRVSSFVRDGQYQIYADNMEPDGVGALYIAYDQLRRKLEGEGLFDQSRKPTIPKIPNRVGLITSPTGAAVRDMINVCGRRFPYARIILFPALVQGAEAAPSLVNGVKYFNDTDSADVIIIGRGGGSIEDLWAFNDETLARTVAASHIPIISAVGHETDFTICDFAASCRAPTPSAAAELAVPVSDELKRKIYNLIAREGAVLTQQISARRDIVKRLADSRAITAPTANIDDRRMNCAALSDRLERAAKVKTDTSKSFLALYAGKLSALDPLAVLARGYSAIYKGDSVIKSVDDVAKDDEITMKVSDGEIHAAVIDTLKTL
jgi:exodeoxyribonuclease VII large subunit